MEQYQYIFGPIPSRRLGISLGVDLVPHKTCSMDCLYCECGKTTCLTKKRRAYVPATAVIEELDSYLDRFPAPDYVTFSGSGEPTLNTGLGDVIDHIKKRAPQIRVAVLTNSEGITDAIVLENLLKADLVVPSLDAASQSVFEKINRPCSNVDIREITKGLAEFSRKFSGEIWLEILIIPGVNDQPDEIEKLKAAIEQINPDRIQLNTLDRPGTCADIRPASRETLEKIKHLLSDGRVEIVAKVKPESKVGVMRKDLTSAILETVSRRPCTLEDLMSFLKTDQEKLVLCLEQMVQKKLLNQTVRERGVFYETVHK